MANNKKHSGLLIAFEGLDGSGASVQASLLHNMLKKEGYRSYLTKEPTDSLIGGLIKAGLAGEWKTDVYAQQLLFTADRAHHVACEITSNLESGKIVIVDRYKLSSVAYGSAQIKDVKWLMEINKNFIDPDITFILKIDPKICLTRIKEDIFGVHLYKDEKILSKIQQTYLSLAKKDKKIEVVDGGRDEMEIFDEILLSVKEKLK